jgi:exonuclease III
MNVGEGGVSLFLKKSLNTHVSEHISDRIITASFKLENTKVVVVAVYFPSTNRSFDEYIKTLETLEQISLQYKNNKTNLILLGDFNAHIEENKVGQKWNKRGTKLQSM